MMFPQLAWETIGSVVYDGAMVSAAAVSITAGGCVLLTLVSRVQRHRHGRPIRHGRPVPAR
jgi:hypothetical protein